MEISELVDLIVGVVVALVPVFVAIFRPKVNQYMDNLNAQAESNLNAANYNLLKVILEQAVEATEQVVKALGLDTSAKKKEFAVAMTLRLCEEMNLPFTRDHIEHLLEAIVFNMNGRLSARASCTCADEE